MKKLIFMLGGALIAGGTIFAIQSSANSNSTLPTNTEIQDLKSTNNNNMLTATMRDKMLDLLDKINQNVQNHLSQEKEGFTITKYCRGYTKSANNNALRENCNPNSLQPLYHAIEDSSYGLTQYYNLPTPNNKTFTYDQLVEGSKDLGKHKFCSLTTVMISPIDEVEKSESICMVFEHQGKRWLYTNDHHSRVYCTASCF